jgi:hypothetical protein
VNLPRTGWLAAVPSSAQAAAAEWRRIDASPDSGSVLPRAAGPAAPRQPHLQVNHPRNGWLAAVPSSAQAAPAEWRRIDASPDSGSVLPGAAGPAAHRRPHLQVNHPRSGWLAAVPSSAQAAPTEWRRIDASPDSGSVLPGAAGPAAPRRRHLQVNLPRNGWLAAVPSSAQAAPAERPRIDAPRDSGSVLPGAGPAAPRQRHLQENLPQAQLPPDGWLVTVSSSAQPAGTPQRKMALQAPPLSAAPRKPAEQPRDDCASPRRKSAPAEWPRIDAPRGSGSARPAAAGPALPRQPPPQAKLPRDG